MTAIWIKCTLADKKAKQRSIWVNMTVAASFTEFQGGTRIWFPSGENGGDSCADVTETPEQIVDKIGNALQS